jgi:hypothetical protein
MSDEWAASIPANLAFQAARLWNFSDARLGIHADRLWLRGASLNDEIEHELRSMLDCERFHVGEDHELRLAGAILSVGRLPDIPWSRLSDWFELRLPAASFPSRPPAPVELRLVRNDDPSAANLLLTQYSIWRNFAITAPQVRLARWSFAACDDGRTAIRGIPTPPLPGISFVEQAAVAVPIGWTWAPAVHVNVLRNWLELEAGDIALLTPDGACEVIPGDGFVRATRSAVRNTGESVRAC